MVVLLLFIRCLLLLPFLDYVIVLSFVVYYVVSNTSFEIILMGENRAGCFVLFVLLLSHSSCVALPCRVPGLSSVFDRGIS